MKTKSNKTSKIVLELQYMHTYQLKHLSHVVEEVLDTVIQDKLPLLITYQVVPHD